MINKEFLKLLACPKCKKELKNEKNSLICNNCKKKYEIINGIPVLLIGKQ
jgi:hypothetical protein